MDIIDFDIFFINKAVDFFVSNVDNCYISHGEVMFGRADSDLQWRNDIKTVLTEEFSETLKPKTDHGFKKIKLAVSEDGQVVGLLYYAAIIDILSPYGTLYDIVVDRNFRARGLGKKLYSIFESDMRSLGISTLFLESGIRNTNAHKFFNTLGYDTISITMMKKV